MNDDKRTEVVRLLCNDALEAVDDSSAEAALLLIDAAMSIALNRLGPVGAHEMSGILVGHILQEGDSFLRHAYQRGAKQ